MNRFIIVLSFSFFVFLGSKPAIAVFLEIQTENKVIKVGDSFSVKVILSGQEQTMGADVILNYPVEILSGQEVTSAGLYPIYNPAQNMRINHSIGKITISGSANLGQPIKPNGLFAIVKFKAVKPGQAIVNVDYQKGSTVKSGVLDFSGNELLERSPEPLIVTVNDFSFLEKLVDFFVNLKDSIYVMIANANPF